MTSDTARSGDKRRRLSPFLLLLAAALPLAAQDSRYFVSLGPWYSHYETPRQGGLFTGFAWRIADKGKWFSYSTVDMQWTSAAVSTGGGYAVVENADWTVLLIGDTTLAAPALDKTAASPAVFRRWRDHWWVFAAVRVPAATPIKPVFRFGIGRTF